MKNITLTKRTFWTWVWKLYDQLQAWWNSGFVVIPKDSFDPDRIVETPKNKQAYQKSIKWSNPWYSLEDAYSLVMQ